MSPRFARVSESGRGIEIGMLDHRFDIVGQGEVSRRRVPLDATVSVVTTASDG